MKRQVSLYEAKTNLSQLVEDAARGDVIVIAKNGKPRAQLMVITPADDGQPKKRALGQWAKYLTPEQLADIGSEDWLRRWKEADAEIQQDFEASLNRDFAEPGRDYKWADTSSTPTPSSGQKIIPRRSGPKRAKSSKTRKIRSS